MERINKTTNLTIVAICVLLGAGHAHADAVTGWNEIMQGTVANLLAPAQARSAAIVQLAVFEAVNSINPEYRPYYMAIRSPRWASPEAAAIAAAHHTLEILHPGSKTVLDGLRDEWLSEIPNGPGKFSGILVGLRAANAILELRADDGSGAVVPYTPGTAPGDWRPTPPAFLPALFPGLGRVDTFGIRDGRQFRASPPPALHSAIYARDYNEVKAIGAVDSRVRPQDRTDVARFYNVVLGVPLWNEAARQASDAQGKTLSENARDFALLAMALADSTISVFETKYHYEFWRPVTAIRAGDTDRNRRTDPDPTWTPLIAAPPHPSYPSAHASSSNAARRVLESVYGEDGLAITLTDPRFPGLVLEYTDWERMTDDIDDARIYGGVHFRFDQEAGARQGRRVGSYIVRNYLRPLREDHDSGEDH